MQGANEGITNNKGLLEISPTPLEILELNGKTLHIEKFL